MPHYALIASSAKSRLDQSQPCRLYMNIPRLSRKLYIQSFELDTTFYDQPIINEISTRKKMKASKDTWNAACKHRWSWSSALEPDCCTASVSSECWPTDWQRPGTFSALGLAASAAPLSPWTSYRRPRTRWACNRAAAAHNQHAGQLRFEINQRSLAAAVKCHAESHHGSLSSM